MKIFQLNSPVIRLAVLALFAFGSEVYAFSISHLKHDSHSERLTILGKNFGNNCGECELIADYGEFKYALSVRSWRDNQIDAELSDLGKRDLVKIHIRKGSTRTKPMSIQLKPYLVPQRKENGLVKPGMVSGLIVHEYKTSEPLGEKGRKRYDVSQPVAQCGKQGLQFDHAVLLLGRRTRFGHAKISQQPSRNCSRCQPVEVQYAIEPTGVMHYQVHIYNRKIRGVCKQQVRR